MSDQPSEDSGGTMPPYVYDGDSVAAFISPAAEIVREDGPMDDLVAFINARWDDLERIAQDGKAACAHLDLCSDSGGEWWEHFGHENGPDIVLADIASKRQLLAMHQGAHWCPTDDRPQYFNGVSAYRRLSCPVHRLLAQPFAQHPDFREEWK